MTPQDQQLLVYRDEMIYFQRRHQEALDRLLAEMARRKIETIDIQIVANSTSQEQNKLKQEYKKT